MLSLSVWLLFKEITLLILGKLRRLPLLIEGLDVVLEEFDTAEEPRAVLVEGPCAILVEGPEALLKSLDVVFVEGCGTMIIVEQLDELSVISPLVKSISVLSLFFPFPFFETSVPFCNLCFFTSLFPLSATL